MNTSQSTEMDTDPETLTSDEEGHEQDKNTIISLNCDGKWSIFEEIIGYIIKRNITVAMLQDTPNESDRRKYPSLETIKFIKTNRGLTLVYNSNQIEPIMITNTSTTTLNTSTQTIKMQLKGLNSPINLCNIYIKPKTTTSELMNTLKNLGSTIKNMGFSRTIIMGDINSTSIEWCPMEKCGGLGDSRTNNTNKSYINLQLARGRLIRNFASQNKLTCINDRNAGHTAYNKFLKTKAYIDIALVGSKCYRTWHKMNIINLKAEGNRTMGHKILQLEQRTKGTNIKKHKTKHETKTEPKIHTHTEIGKEMTRINRAIDNIKIDNNWIQKERSEQIKYMNDLAECVYDYLKHIQKITSNSTNRTNRNRNKPKPTIHKLKQMSIELKSLKCKPKRQNRIKQNLLNWIRKETMIARERNPNREDIWNKIDATENIINGTETETEIMLKKENINEIMKEKFPFVDRKEAEKIIENDKSDKNHDITKIPTTWEIEQALTQIKNKKHTGQEGIKFKTFNNNLEHTKRFLIEICRISKYTSTIPNNCKITLGKIIPKKKKGAYRIVHLATPLLCLIEQIILHQLEYQLEINDKIDRRQYGFTRLRDRHDLVTRIIERIIKNKMKHNNKTTSAIINLDIKGAFDNVDHNSMVNKLYKTFGYESNITKWIAQFLMDKKITLEFDKIRSEITDICKGVPQGSCLGPTLWNFAIEEITTEMNKQDRDKFEILTYADDIIITIQDYKQGDAQRILNELTNRLNALKLEVDPEKCSIMYTKQLKNTTHDVPRISNKPIPEVKKTSTLGISIKHNLKLDIESIDKHEKLKANILKLERANSLGIINKKYEWDIVINSLIRSITVSNNYPVLAIDPKARKQVTERNMKIYRQIFDWPQNISQKAIKTIMNEQTIDTQIERLIYKKIYKEEGEGYRFIQDILNNNVTPNTPTSYTAKIRRRIPDPEIKLEILKLKEGTVPERTWYIRENKKTTQLVTLDQTLNITNIETYYHKQYNIAYFNSLATIYNIIKKEEQKDMTTDHTTERREKTILISEHNSIIQALENFKNNDARIIQLREMLYENDWKIALTDRKFMETLNDKIHQKLENNQHKQAIKQLDKPNIDDYKYRNQRRKEIEEKEHINKTTELTRFCNSIHPSYNIWAKLNPTWLSGKRMLLISGMVQDKHGKLAHFKQYEEKCKCLHRSTSNWILHKAMECPENTHTDMDIRETTMINEYKKATDKYKFIEDTLTDHHKQQTLLRTLCKTAFNHNTIPQPNGQNNVYNSQHNQ